ncbi:hypothetical protein HYW72_00775 [Candidatus Nomurabacteria bacterium]|nr:hypothetical protein [Candidatus Nomurabacteria bacterium]
MKRLSVIFLFSFVVNIVWENAHSFLYANYMGGSITETILAQAALWDAIIITFICLPFLYIGALEKKSWLIIILGMAVAIAIELYALKTGRWAYNVYMPIIPIIRIGLTPTVQLGALGYFSFLIQRKLFNKLT